KEAEPLYRRALTINEKALGPQHPRVATSLNNLAAVAFSSGRLEEAWACAWHARRVVLEARQSAGTSALARSSFQAEQLPQDLLPCLALKLGKEADVLQLLEQGRALALRELLTEARAETASVLPEEERERVSAALGRVNALSAGIEKAARKGEPLAELRYQLQRAEMDYESLMAELRDRHRQFVAAETASGISSADALKSPALSEGTAIVGWMEFGDWAWGYVVRRRGVRWVELPRAAGPPGDVELVQRILAACRRPGSRPPSARDLAELYRRRFAPLRDHLDGVERLIIIAQGWAAALPVEMLLTSEPATQDISEWPWLCERYEVSYAPSVTTLDVLCRQRGARPPGRWRRPLFALADPPFSWQQLAQMKSSPEAATEPGPPIASAGATRFEPAEAPPRLPGTRREVEMLAALLGPDSSLLLTGPNASERRLFEANAAGQLAGSRYIHLATHGIADSARPELSALMLARVPKDADFDGMLQMREVFHLKLDADLVVLSACQTGLGKQLRGEGMVGLATAFFFAGTPSLVLSLWSVSDVSTALLMHRFYGNLLAGRDKAAALREAKAWLRNLTRNQIAELGGRDPHLPDLTRGLTEVKRADKGELAGQKPFAHPHHWAPFVVTGDPL
ncbi:MAG: CHAT domain-containing protein, partial [Planctomycetota bacterium]